MKDVMLKDVRGAYLYLFEPAPPFGGNNDEKLHYKGTWIIVPNSENDKALVAAIKEAAKERWPNAYEGIVKKLVNDGELPYHRSEYLGPDGTPRPGFEGSYRLTTKSTSRPVVIDRDRTPLAESDGRPYSGCYCNVLVSIKADEFKGKKYVSARLRAVQFVRDGDALSGGTAVSAEVFPDLGVTESGASSQTELF